MRQKGWAVGVVVLILLALAAWLVLSYIPHTPQGAPPTPQAQRIPPVDTAYAAPATLVVRHALINGANIYSGDLPIRSCNTIATGLSTSGNNPIQLTINFKVFDGDTSCEGSTGAESDTQPFTVSFSSKVSTTTPVLQVLTINGASIPFTVVEAK